MQTPEISIPAWTYQAPLSSPAHADQLYYRTETWCPIETSYPDQKAPNPGIMLFRWAERELAKLTTTTGCGEAAIELDATSLLALRDACNDALQDIAQAREARERRESLEEIREDMARAREMGLDGPGAYYVHPDVHYVATQEEATAKLRSIGEGIVIVDPSVAQATAAEA